jgi:hypothetical protein
MDSENPADHVLVDVDRRPVSFQQRHRSALSSVLSDLAVGLL